MLKPVSALGTAVSFFSKGLCILLCCIAALPSTARAGETDQGLDFKYMYFWDRNGTWNNTPAFAYFRRLNSSWKLKWDQEFDGVTGASRRLGLKNIGRLGDNDLKLDGITGASRVEIRHSEQATLAYSQGDRNASASFYFSDENDYRSYSPAVSGSLDFNERNTTLGASGAVFFDNLHPTGPFRGLGGDRRIVSLNATLTQLFTPLSLGTLTASVIRSSGYLGHPYNPIVTDSGAMLLENLPDKKTAVALAGQVIQGFHLAGRLGSVRLGGRHYRDDWKLISNTAEVQWYQYVVEGTYVRLRLRGYDQGTAAFAKESFEGNEVYRTPDIRYYAFSSLTAGLKIASVFPDSWNESAWLPDRWDLSYDHGPRDTRGEEDGVSPFKHYQLFPTDQYYVQGTLMAGISFDL